MELTTDQRLGPYRVIRLLGQGAMGSVYEAEDTRQGARVALKVFSPEGKVDDSLQRRFQSEASILLHLRHPRLVRVTDQGIDSATGLLYFVMDLVLSREGELRTLADVPTGELSEKVILGWFEQLASVLDYIHAEGVVHRDIKLENILIDAEGHVVLSDFGIAHCSSQELRKKVNAAQTIVQEVVSGKRLLMGTAGYLAPEVARGDMPTAAADVYALGVLFIYLLTGMWYAPGSKVAELLKEMDCRWEEVLPPMVASEPCDRPKDLTALSRILSVGRLASKVWRFVRRKLALLAAAVIGGVAVTLVRLLFE